MMTVMCAVMSAQVEYFVSGTGLDTNDGLTAATPVKTFLKARNLINASHTATTDVTINIIGTVTDLKGHSAFNFNTAENVTLTVKGESAATSILQKLDDATWLDYVATNKAAGRFFSMPQNKGEGNLTVIFEDLTVKNFGDNNTNGGMFMNALLPCTIVVRRCNFKNGIARSGALFQTNGNQRVVDFTMEDCSVDNMLSFNKGAVLQSPIIVRGYSTGTFKNCVFSNCGMDPRARDANTISQFSQFGSVITFDPTMGTLESDLPDLVTGEVTNCTFVNNGYAPTLATDAVYDSIVAQVGDTLALAVVSALVDSGESVVLSFNNNLVIGNGGDATSAVDFKAIVATDGTYTSTSFTHNVMNSVIGVDATTCDTSAAYMYSSPEIMVDAVDDSLVMSMTSTGVMYVKAAGTSVKAGADMTTSTLTDITGAARVNYSVGAYEVTEAAGLSNQASLSFTVYPNPTTGLVQFSGVEGVVSVEVINQLGQRVLSTMVANSQVDLSSVGNGMYFVKVMDAQGQQGVQTLVVR